MEAAEEFRWNCRVRKASEEEGNFKREVPREEQGRTCASYKSDNQNGVSTLKNKEVTHGVSQMPEEVKANKTMIPSTPAGGSQSPAHG